MALYFQYPNVVQRGATIATLLASVFREGCRSLGVKLNEYGIIEGWSFSDLLQIRRVDIIIIITITSRGFFPRDFQNNAS